MSTPPGPGTYQIYSRVLSPSGEQLALTFNGSEQPITVTALESYNPAQIWVIQNHNELQFVIPYSNQELKANYLEGTIGTRDGGHPCWGIRNDKGYFIQDGERTIFWSINDAEEGAQVKPLHNSIGEKHLWILRPVGVN
ncbi:hypothetical protein FRC07_005280 [Ceratobasidium sp. 392]|nr:hypothetical protein FRC07_005280 [Ceratobasidium sp. 392]